MKTLLEFHVGGTAYCLPIEATRAVRSAAGLCALPAPKPGVVGLLPGDPPLTVISPFGSGGNRVVVVQASEATYGLLVHAVTGLRHVEDLEIRAAPVGQDRALISGSVTIGGQLVLLADASAMEAGM